MSSCSLRVGYQRLMPRMHPTNRFVGNHHARRSPRVRCGLRPHDPIRIVLRAGPWPSGKDDRRIENPAQSPGSRVSVHSARSDSNSAAGPTARYTSLEASDAGTALLPQNAATRVLSFCHSRHEVVGGWHQSFDDVFKLIDRQRHRCHSARKFRLRTIRRRTH